MPYLFIIVIATESGTIYEIFLMALQMKVYQFPEAAAHAKLRKGKRFNHLRIKGNKSLFCAIQIQVLHLYYF
ncbi:MAG: hypothetical protein EZS28_001967 [Streblomastix strix]|uniref:Uncharacterized protein n=1 Tax=Streblomastix strix TaxID=222440 RepID=A0A5J4X5L4_9EUKA|nr:MAG: hypothetical protein EZS28_001967 [Streblomastix strix]